MEPDAEVSRWYAALFSADELARARAAASLAHVGTRALPAVERMVALLDDADRSVRASVVAALFRLADARVDVGSFLRRALARGYPSPQIAWVLEHLHPGGSRPTIS